MSRLAGFVLALALLVVLPASSAQAATCTPPRYPGSGYFTSLKATKVSCSEAGKVALAFHKCRTKRSVTGRCSVRTKVRNFTCRETRTKISTEINGRVKCTRGSRKVELTYQQNT